jgi:pimeloyl-ACP methyl ester carboxylesterase
MSWSSRSTVASRDGTPIALYAIGSGPDLVVVGGALQSAQNYLGLAEALSGSFTVTVYDRRGRGNSGAHGQRYSLETERQDLLSVQAATGARAVFGHSYGGLVVLETLAGGGSFEAASVYEPGVSIDGSISVNWLPRYRSLLGQGDEYGAFAHFIKSNSQAPAAVRLLPHWYLRAVLHAMPRFRTDVAPLLEGNAVEHEQVALKDGHHSTYATITSRLQILAGSRSPQFVLRTMDVLAATIPGSTALVVPGMVHRAPLARRPVALAGLISRHLSTAS